MRTATERPLIVIDRKRSGELHLGKFRRSLKTFCRWQLPRGGTFRHSLLSGQLLFADGSPADVFRVAVMIGIHGHWRLEGWRDGEWEYIPTSSARLREESA